MFNRSVSNQYYYEEVWNTHTALVNLLMTVYDNSEQKLAQLIDDSVNLSPQDRTVLLAFVGDVIEKTARGRFYFLARSQKSPFSPQVIS
jgi:hypothetical protein